MSAGLLDVNVLIALAWPSHVHHTLAHRWFARNSRRGWATCPLTQLGFVRVSSHPGIIPEAATPREALAALGAIVAQIGHVFWPDAISLTDKGLPAGQIMGHRQFTDAYLLALAVHHRGRLVTLDAAIPAMLASGDPRRSAIEVIREAGPGGIRNGKR